MQQSLFEALLADDAQAGEWRVDGMWERMAVKKRGSDRRPRHHGGMRVGVIDVGSNTVRLLVASGDETLAQRRVVLGLGGVIEESGAIPEPKLAEGGHRPREL